MAKRRLPPRSGLTPLVGLSVNHYAVGDWRPTQDGSGAAEAVSLSLNVNFNEELTADVVLRLRTPKAVDTMIQSLLRHKRSVWPDAP